MTFTFPMALRTISFVRELDHSLRINSRDEPPFSVELAKQLEDLRKVSMDLVHFFAFSDITWD